MELKEICLIVQTHGRGCYNSIYCCQIFSPLFILLCIMSNQSERDCGLVAVQKVPRSKICFDQLTWKILSGHPAANGYRLTLFRAGEC